MPKLQNSVMAPPPRTLYDLVSPHVQDFVGNAVGKPVDDFSRGNYLEGAAGLASLFAKPATMLMTPTEAEGAILPFKGAAKQAMLEASSKGLSRKDMWDQLGALWTGNKWEHFTPDKVNMLPDHLRKAGVSQRLSDVISNPNLPGLGDYTKLRHDQLSGITTGGYSPSRSLVQLQKDLSALKAKQVLQHEFQHVSDYAIPNRSVGTTSTIDNAGDYQSLLRSSKNDPNISYDNVDHYLHNQGEIRARMNDRLQRDDNMWMQNYFDNGLQSMFDSSNANPSRVFHDNMIWGGD